MTHINTNNSIGQGTEGIDAITYSTDKWDESALFFADWGLTNISQSETLQEWETLNGARVNVRRTDDDTLPPAMEKGPTLREVVWGVRSDAQLETLAQALAFMANILRLFLKHIGMLQRKQCTFGVQHADVVGRADFVELINDFSARQHVTNTHTGQSKFRQRAHQQHLCVGLGVAVDFSQPSV